MLAPSQFAPDATPMLHYDHGWHGEDDCIQVAMKSATFAHYYKTYLTEIYGQNPTPAQCQEARRHVQRVRYWHGCTQDPCNVKISTRERPYGQQQRSCEPFTEN
jgi:hypothetical protein